MDNKHCNNNEDVMKPYFPAILDGCESISKQFFDCLNKNLQPFGDLEVAKREITQCKQLKNNYEKCTEHKLKNNQEPLFFLTSYKDSSVEE